VPSKMVVGTSRMILMWVKRGDRDAYDFVRRLNIAP
jgi:hypothetical protein